MLVVYPLVYLYPVSARVRATEVEWGDLLVVYESPPQIRSTHAPTTTTSPKPQRRHTTSIHLEFDLSTMVPTERIQRFRQMRPECMISASAAPA